MNERYPKYIITNDEFRISYVTLHRELKTSLENPIGGGWWHMDRENKILLLYAKSYDFGSVTKEEILKTISEDDFFREKYNGFVVKYSPELKLEQALLNNQEIITL